jgi:Flp pilus assembly CpaE family ATPase
MEREVPATKIIPIIVKHRGRAETIRLEEVRSAIGADTIEIIPEDHKSACAAINFGRPLADEAPRSPLRAGIAKLATTFVAALRAERTAEPRHGAVPPAGNGKAKTKPSKS